MRRVIISLPGSLGSSMRRIIYSSGNLRSSMRRVFSFPPREPVKLYAQSLLFFPTRAICIPSTPSLLLPPGYMLPYYTLGTLPAPAGLLACTRQHGS